VRTRIKGHTRGLSRRKVREALWFFADELGIKKATINLSFSSDFPRGPGAEMLRLSAAKRTFSIKCSTKNGPYRTLEDLAHEMIHVKQFLSGTLTERGHCTAWRGQVYRGYDVRENEKYWNAPWEIDAYGRSYWLYKKCRLHLLRCGYRLRKCSKS